MHEPPRWPIRPLAFFDTPLSVLVRKLPLLALLPLAPAIFTLFSVLGPVTDLLNGANRPMEIMVRGRRGDPLGFGLWALGFRARLPISLSSNQQEAD